MSEVAPADVAGVELFVDEQANLLKARVTPMEERPPTTQTELMDRLTAAGYGDWFFLDGALVRLMDAYRSAAKECVIDMAERRDAEASLSVSNDAMSAHLTLLPAYGGKLVERADIDRILAERRVVAGIREEAIQAALEAGRAEHVVVAEGVPPLHGDDARFESLIPEARDRRPRIDERGRADYHELGSVVTVNAGDALMRRHPATQGTDGSNIFGKAVAAKPGKNQLYAPKLPGSRPDPDDGDLLRAEISGLPVIVENGVTVEPVLSVKMVDVASGNLEFAGSIVVAGDVREGLKLYASGDILVGGTVEGAELRAGGDIEVRGGVIGRALSGDEQDREALFARLYASGVVSARFIKFARIEARAVSVQDMLLHCETTAQNEVRVSGRGKRGGQIIGGVTRAMMAVEALQLGSPGNVPTVVHVGMDQPLRARRESLEAELQAKRGQWEELDRVLKSDSANRPGGENLLERARNTIANLEREIDALQGELDQVKERLEAARNSMVKVGDRVYGSAQVHVRDRVWRVMDESIGGTFLERDGELVFDHAK